MEGLYLTCQTKSRTESFLSVILRCIHIVEIGYISSHDMAAEHHFMSPNTAHSDSTGSPSRVHLLFSVNKSHDTKNKQTGSRERERRKNI